MHIFFICLITLISQIQGQDKMLLTIQENGYSCMVPARQENLAEQIEKEKRYYQSYLSSLPSAAAVSPGDPPDWRSFMSPVEDQGSLPTCGIYAAVAATECQLQISHGGLIGEGINIDEMELYDPDFPYSGFVERALSHIRLKKVSSEKGAFPNWDGVKWTIKSHTDNIIEDRQRIAISGIQMIKKVLQYGPVTAQFRLYKDFARFFASKPKGVYRWDGESLYSGAHHAVVIVNYYEDRENPENSYWLCKNSWGESFADDGYFRIGFGECGIESINNYIVFADESCLAKIIPDMQVFRDAVSGRWAEDERLYVVSDIIVHKYDLQKIPLNRKPQLVNNASIVVKGSLNDNESSPVKRALDSVATVMEGDSWSTQTGHISKERNQKDFMLHKNYPDPFNPETQIPFELFENTHVVLTVYNILGQKIKELLNAHLPGGIHEVRFDASGLSNGTYFYRISTPKSTEIKRMLLVK